MTTKPSLSNEELLKLLETAPEIDLPETITMAMVNPDEFDLTEPELKTIVMFLDKYNIKPGDKGVSYKHLYTLYKIVFQNRITQNMFSSGLRKLNRFETTYTGIRIDYKNLKIDGDVLMYAAYKKKLSKTRPLKTSRQLDAYLGFLKHYKIKKGKILVNVAYLYKIYKLFTSGKNIYVLYDFKRMLDKSFGYKWMRGQKFYLLNVPKEGLLCREDQENHLEN